MPRAVGVLLEIQPSVRPPHELPVGVLVDAGLLTYPLT